MCIISQLKRTRLTLALLLVAAPAFGQSLPPNLVGEWDVSVDACASSGRSATQVNIASERIETFGGNAIIREVDQIGDVTFAAGDFEQLEGAADISPRTRAYFRFDQKNGPDRMTLAWKDVQTLDLVKCGTSVRAEGGARALPEVPSLTNKG